MNTGWRVAFAAVLLLVCSQLILAAPPNSCVMNSPLNGSARDALNAVLSATAQGTSLNIAFYKGQFENVTSNDLAGYSVSGTSSKLPSGAEWRDGNLTTQTGVGSHANDSGDSWDVDFPAQDGKTILLQKNFTLNNSAEAVSLRLKANRFSTCGCTQCGDSSWACAGNDAYFECYNASGATWVVLDSATTGGCDGAGDNGLNSNKDQSYAVPDACRQSNSVVQARVRIVHQGSLGGNCHLNGGGVLYVQDFLLNEVRAKSNASLIASVSASNNTAVTTTYSNISDNNTYIDWFALASNSEGYKYPVTWNSLFLRTYTNPSYNPASGTTWCEVQGHLNASGCAPDISYSQTLDGSGITAVAYDGDNTSTQSIDPATVKYQVLRFTKPSWAIDRSEFFVANSGTRHSFPLSAGCFNYSANFVDVMFDVRGSLGVNFYMSCRDATTGAWTGIGSWSQGGGFFALGAMGMTWAAEDLQPVAVDTALSTTNVFMGTTLTGSFKATDDSAANITADCRWYRNGSIFQNVTTTLLNNTYAVIDAVNDSNRTIGTTYKLSCRAYDGKTYSSYLDSAIVTVRGVNSFSSIASNETPIPVNQSRPYLLTGQCQVNDSVTNKSAYWALYTNGNLTSSGLYGPFSTNATINITNITTPYLTSTTYTFSCKAVLNGVNDSFWVNSSLQIQNSPPLLTTVYVNQSITNGNSPVGGFCAGTDLVNQDNVSFFYQWYKDGATTAYLTNISCFQETATTAACTGQSTANSTYALSYSPLVYPTPQLGYFYINYTKPQTALNATWRVKHGLLNTYNVAVPQSCLNQNPSVLMFRVVSFHSSGTFDGIYSYGQCFDGSAWQTITNTSSGTGGDPQNCMFSSAGTEPYDGSYTTAAQWHGDSIGQVQGWWSRVECSNWSQTQLAAVIFEEAVNWTWRPYYGYNTGLQLVHTLPSSAIGKNLVTHERWNFSCGAIDSAGASTAMQNASFLTNDPPNASSALVVAVNSGNTTIGFNCTHTYSDRQSDPESGSTYLWYYNGNLTPITTQFLGAGNVTLGTLVCTVTPADGYQFGNATNSSIFTINDNLPPVLSNASYPATGTSTAPVSFSINCTDNSGNLASGFPKFQWTDVNDIVQPNISMNAAGGGLFTRSFTFSTVGTYKNFIFYCTDANTNPASINGTHTLIISTAGGGPPPGGGGGGGGSQSVIVVTTGENATLFTVQTETGAQTSQLLMYPAQVREQTYVIQSYVQNELLLNAVCEGPFCNSVTLSSEKVKLGGMQTTILTAKLAMPSSAQYGQIFRYTIKIGDDAGHTAVLQNEVSVSQLSKWYSKFVPVVKKGDSGYWFSIGDTALPKLILYLLLVTTAITTAWLLIPKGKKYADVATLIYIGTGLLTFLISSLVY